MKTKNTLLLVLALAVLSVQAVADTREEIGSAIGTIVPFMSTLCRTFRDAAGALASLIFLWAAVQWVMSRDEPAKRKQAKDMMIAVIVGVIIIGISIYIINSIVNSLGLIEVEATFCPL